MSRRTTFSQMDKGVLEEHEVQTTLSTSAARLEQYKKGIIRKSDPYDAIITFFDAHMEAFRASLTDLRASTARMYYQTIRSMLPLGDIRDKDVYMKVVGGFAPSTYGLRNTARRRYLEFIGANPETSTEWKATAQERMRVGQLKKTQLRLIRDMAAMIVAVSQTPEMYQKLLLTLDDMVSAAYAAAEATTRLKLAGKARRMQANLNEVVAGAHNNDVDKVKQALLDALALDDGDSESTATDTDTDYEAD